MQATAAAAPAVGSAAIPEAEHRIPPTSRAELDAAVRALREKKDAWAGLALADRIRLLDDTIRATVDVAARWVAAALEAKGIRPGTPAAGEEWIGGPMVWVRNVRLLAETLRAIEREGTPRFPGAPFARAGGQVVVPVFPASIFDRLLYSGITAEIWMQRDVTLGNLRDHVAAAYRPGRVKEGKVALVLGAGNVASIGPMDALYKLYAEDQVVVLKMNPVNEYLGPIFAEAMAPFVSGGFLRIVYGGAAEGGSLCQHPGVDEIHITGSDKTHDAIVFGTGEEGRRNKAARRPILTKRITSELGNVSPMIVVPGPWSAQDLEFQAANLASSLANNAGFNCNATRVIVQHRGWKERDALLQAVRRVFSRTPPRMAYYPGAADRYRSFRAAHPEADEIGSASGGRLPWFLVPDVDPERRDDICFTTEAFCSVTSETALEAGSVVEYIRRAVEFANDTLWGTLNAGILVHPRSMKDPAVAAAVEQAVADLRFGSVAINAWPAISYALVATTWGAYPGHDLHDVRSGIGVVHNTYLLEKTEKSVVRCPFRSFPKPPWFVTHRRSHEVGERLVAFEAAPSFGKLPAVVWAALRG
jgi:acyl-CoA reductase-like NAD-dependent aldehyde dehydrogenase